MWENERRKELIRNIIIGVILVAAALGLGFGCLTVMQRIEKEDEQLMQVHSSQREELSSARQESKEEISQIYQQHQDVLAQYLPGIVCWGDSL
ncbi:MAG: hypothetical protein IKB71_09155, partial [Lentisphaeria bacterium]|nr:hypothetical protein [Lentisphaeria bacterium]